MNLRRSLVYVLTGFQLLAPAGHSAENAALRSNPLFSTTNDPPALLTIAVVNGRTVPAVITFKRYGSSYSVYTPQVSPIPLSPLTSKDPRTRAGGFGSGPGGLPDPAFDPWDIDLPDPPDPWDDVPPPPDLPDPFDDIPLPEPPLDFPPDLDDDPLGSVDPVVTTDSGNGTASSVSTTPGGSPTLKTIGNDASTNRNATSVKIGTTPTRIAFAPDQKTFAVANYGSASVSVVELATMKLLRTISLPAEVRPYGIAFSRDGAKLYLTNFLRNDSQLIVVDFASGSVLARTPVPPFPASVTTSKDGNSVWVTSYFEGSITIFETLTNTPIALLRGFPSAWNIKFNSTGTRAYVSGANVPYGTVKVVDTATLQTLASVDTGSNTTALYVTPSGRHVFAVNSDAGTISQIDTATNSVVRTIKVGERVFGVGGLHYRRP